jgi:hypothetical protein
MIAPRAAALVLCVTCVMVAAAADSKREAPPDGPRTQAAALGVELENHPEATAADVYKLLHQGVFGPGHAIEDRRSAARWIDDEIAALGPATVEEALCQPLGGATPMVRIHLRPYLAAGDDPAELLDAFVASAVGDTGDAAAVDAAVQAAVAFMVERGLGSLAGDVQTLASTLASQGYPAVHHSERYVELYRPAYRVVRLDLARAKGWCPGAEEAAE